MDQAPRIVGVDVARGLAILGMFVAHAVPRPDDGELLADGRSSILFATLAGVSLGIMTGADRPRVRGSRSDRVTSIVLRALVLFVLGVLLWSLDSGIAIILDYYAFMFLLLVPVLFLRRSVLGSIAVILAFVAPLIAGRIGDSPADAIDSFLPTYLLTGYYPALIWLPFLLAGLIAARSGLARRRTRIVLIGGGISAAVLGYGAAAILPGVSAEAHSSSTAEVFGSGGVALAIIGLLLLATSGSGRIGRIVRFASWPLAATGSMALTVYTLQIITLAIVSRVQDSTGDVVYPGWALLISMSLASVVFASLWRWKLGTGPLERVLRTITRPRRPIPVP